MKWWNKSHDIPIYDECFQRIINGLLFNCPSCVRKTTNMGKENGGKQKKKTQYIPVSARETSFKKNGISGSALLTILAQIRRPLVYINAYEALKPSANIEDSVEHIIKSTNCADDMFELMVYHIRSDMPEAEAIYYYIRNAFAHGSFEVYVHNNDRVYLLESCKDGTIKARMRLKEKTLLRYVELTHMSLEDVFRLQRKKRK